VEYRATIDANDDHEAAVKFRSELPDAELWETTVTRIVSANVGAFRS